MPDNKHSQKSELRVAEHFFNFWLLHHRGCFI